MRSMVQKILVSSLLALFIASAAAPGLAMHNCRHFGTRSTQLCDCCKAELAETQGCCAEKASATREECPTGSTAGHSDNSLESACCFVSYEGPFLFDGLKISGYSLPDADKNVATYSFAIPVLLITPDLEFDSQPLRYRHTSDPPSYILTHSFRC